jgi:hypothetical protein
MLAALAVAWWVTRCTPLLACGFTEAVTCHVTKHVHWYGTTDAAILDAGT